MLLQKLALKLAGKCPKPLCSCPQQPVQWHHVPHPPSTSQVLLCHCCPIPLLPVMWPISTCLLPTGVRVLQPREGCGHPAHHTPRGSTRARHLPGDRGQRHGAAPAQNPLLLCRQRQVLASRMGMFVQVVLCVSLPASCKRHLWPLAAVPWIACWLLHLCLMHNSPWHRNCSCAPSHPCAVTFGTSGEKA